MKAMDTSQKNIRVYPTEFAVISDVPSFLLRTVPPTLTIQTSLKWLIEVFPVLPPVGVKNGNKRKDILIAEVEKDFISL